MVEAIFNSGRNVTEYELSCRGTYERDASGVHLSEGVLTVWPPPCPGGGDGAGADPPADHQV